MRSTVWSAGLLVVLLAAPAPAQVFLAPGPGLAVQYTRFTRNTAFNVSFRRPFGFPYGGPFGPPFGVPFATSTFSQVVVVTPPPIFIPRPIIFEPDPIILPAPLPRLRAEPIEEDVIELPLPGKEAGVFRPLDPDNRDRARQPVPAPPPPPRQEDPPPRRDPPPERPMPPPQRRQDPVDEATRQLELGREAFARGEYGRAAERFRQAVDLAPANPLAHLLLGQAHLAAGNHRRSFDALLLGLRLQPDWPRQPFRPLDLYGDNVVDHGEHLRLLEDLQAANPDDPILVFLTGYQLWFDGRREEALEHLLRAGPVLPDPGLIERFLQAMPNQPTL